MMRYRVLAICLALIMSAPAVAKDTIRATDGSVAIKGSHNSATIGITEAEYRERLEKDTAALRADVKRLDNDLRKAIREEGRASGKVDLLREQLTARESALSAAEGKLLDVEASFADLQATVVKLTNELTEAREQNPGRIPVEIFDEAIAALKRGDLESADKIISPLLDQKSIEDVIHDQAQLSNGKVSLYSGGAVCAGERRILGIGGRVIAFIR